MPKNKIKTMYDASEILFVIDRLNIINEERNLLNSIISEHYTPLLTNAAKNKNQSECDKLLSELPDCPFLMTAYRIIELNNI